MYNAKKGRIKPFGDSEVRTHAHWCGLRPERSALDHSAMSPTVYKYAKLRKFILFQRSKLKTIFNLLELRFPSLLMNSEIFQPSLDSSKLTLPLPQYLLRCPQLFDYRLTEGAKQKILERLFSEFWRNNEAYRNLFFPNGFGEGPGRYKIGLAQGHEGAEYSPAQKGKACCHIFKKGEGSYWCRNCSLDETCVFCSRCYHATNHEGHDISFLVNTGSGGCCDCGDPEAWKVPINCAFHSPDPSNNDSLDGEKKQDEEQLPNDFLDSIHETISTVLDFMLDTLSCSPEDMTPPKTEEKVKKEALESGNALGNGPEGSEENISFAVVLWNDEHHSFNEVIEQVRLVTSCTESEAKRIAERVDSYGRDIVEFSEDIPRLLDIARKISAIGLAVTIRSARDTFREEMCAIFIEWLKDMASGRIGSHPNILRNIISQELCKEWRKPLRVKRGKKNLGKSKQKQISSGSEINNIVTQETNDYMSDDDDDIMEQADLDGDGRFNEPYTNNYIQNPQSGGDFEMFGEDELLVNADPMEEDESQSSSTSSGLAMADDFRKKLRLDKFLTLDLRLWKEARAGLREIYIGTLVISSEFKKVLGIRFARKYIRLADAFLVKDREPEHSIILFSVQIFTVPKIATLLVTQYSFLSTIFAILHTFFTSNQVGGLGNIDTNAKINCDSESFKNRRYFHIFYDLRYIIGTEAVKKTIPRHPHYLHQYLDLIGLFQGMNPNTRATQQHVEYENDSWINAFNVTLQLAKSCRQFSGCYVANPRILSVTIRKVLRQIYEWSAKRDPDEEEEGERMDETSDGPQDEDKRYRLKVSLQQRSDAWGTMDKSHSSPFIDPIDNNEKQVAFREQEFHEVSFPSNPYLPAFKVVKFKVASQPVSFHHPLHWFLAELLENIELLDDDILKQHGWGSFQNMIMGFDVENDEELDVVLDRAKERILEILDYPLRVLVLLVQIRAGLWVRNGLGIRGQCHHYREVSLRENTYDEDIFLVQTAFILNDPNLVLATLLDRFDMVNWFCGQTIHDIYDSSQLIFVAEELLTLLIICVSERGNAAGLSVEQEIRREIIHALCLAPLSYSDLTKRVTERLHEEGSFDEILRQLANYRPPDSLTDHGSYELKDEYYDEVDTYFIHYSRNNREEAEEALKNRLKKKNEIAGLPNSPILIIPRLVPITNGPYVRIGNLLHARLFNQILFYTLWHVKTDKIKLDTLVDETLHLIMLALLDDDNDIVRESKRKGKQKATSTKRIIMEDGMPGFMHYAVSDYFPVEINSFQPEGPNLLNLLLQLSIDLSFNEFKSKFDFIINKFETLGSDSAKIIVQAHHERQRAELTAKAGEELGLSDFERKKQAAKERQAKIMEQFAKAQQSFIEKHEDLYEEDQDMDEDWEFEPLQPDGSVKTETSWPYPTGTCIVCQEETNSLGLYGMLGLIQPSNMLRLTPFEDKDYVCEVLDLPKNLDRKFERNKPFGVASSVFKDVKKPNGSATKTLLSKGFPSQSCRTGAYASTCGHLMHVKCFETYFSSLEQRHKLQSARNHPEEVQRKEFMCPLCRSLGNALLPIVWKGKKEVFPGVLESQGNFDKWLDEEIGPIVEALNQSASIFLTASSGSAPNFSEVIRRHPSNSSVNVANEYRELTGTMGLSTLTQNTPRRRNSSRAGRFRDAIVQFILPQSLPAPDSTGTEEDSDPSLNIDHSAITEDHETESMRRIYDRLAEVVQLAYRELNIDPDYSDVSLKSVDLLWTLFGYTISCVEISQRGVGNLTSGELTNYTLIDGINTQILTLLRVVSETILTYTNIILGGQSGDIKLKQALAQKLQQLFYGHPVFKIQQNIESSTSSFSFGFTPSHSFTNNKPLLLEDSFLFFAELCLHSKSYGTKFEVHHLMRLMFIAEFIKVIIGICEAGLNEQSKAWREDERIKRTEIVGQNQRENSLSSAKESPRFLRDFVIWVLQKVGNNGGEILILLEELDEGILEKLVRTFCLPFLRKCTILLHARFGIVFPKPVLDNLEANDDEFSKLSSLLNLPPIQEICGMVGDPTSRESTLLEIISGWCTHLYTTRQQESTLPSGFINPSKIPQNPTVYPGKIPNTIASTSSASSSSSSLASQQSQWYQPQLQQKLAVRINHPAIFELVGLPNRLDSLFDTSLRKVCQKCKTVPHDPALCLLCGTFVCSQSYCCSEQERGECNLHAKSCGGDIGIYLLVKRCIILLLHLDNGHFMEAPYLDVHGEVDRGLKRSRPQYLNLKRYDEIRKLWLTHGVPILVARKIEQAFDLGGWTTM
ncbi:hypothetical protein G9A89_011560 [Geosiphon pyriformis]|nr:hypothetical protein G9A89_011560 [Geosiphon pyriformis]